MTLSPLAIAIQLCLGVVCVTGASTAHAQSEGTEYDVPAGPLDQALSRFAQQSGVGIVMDATRMQGLRSPGLQGRFGIDAGFEILLRGSGFEAVKTPTGYVLRSAPARAANSPQAGEPTTRTLAAVQVVDDAAEPASYAGGQISRGNSLGLLGERDFLDSPFSVTSYTSELLQNQSSRSLADAVLHDPAVRYSGSRTQDWEYFSIRGFSQSNSDAMLEGVYGLTASQQVGTESLERVEVMKGPNALLHGMAPNGAIGGVLNLVPKRAGDEPLTQFTGTYYSDAQLGGHLDIGRRFADERVGLRFNGVYRDGDTSIEENSQESVSGAVALDYRGDRFSFTADLGYQSRQNQGLDSDSYLAGDELPRPPRADAIFLQPWTYSKSDAHFALLRGEYAISSVVTAYAAAGFSESEGEHVLSYATDLEQDGDFNENFWGFALFRDSATVEAGLNATLSTGAVSHQLALKLSSLTIEEGGLFNFDGTLDGSLTVPLFSIASNMYSPQRIARPDLRSFPRVPKSTETTLSGVALADTVAFADERVLLTVGARFQQVKVENFDAASGERVEPTHEEDAVTPAAGIVFKASPDFSLYANFIEGLTIGPTAPSNAGNAGEVFPPSKTRQYEAGVKFDFGKLGWSASLFQIARPSGLVDPDTMLFSVDGEQRNRGIEVDVFGELREGSRLLGGLMLLDPELTENEDAALDGKDAPGTPEFTANLGFEWDAPFAQGLTFRLLGIHTGKSYVDSLNNVELPAWTRIDAGARHSFQFAGRPWIVRLNVENLFDKDYWNDDLLYRGAPRTVLLSLTADL